MAAFRTLVYLSILASCSAAYFAMFPMFGRSHYMFVARLGQELAERGHQVKIFVGVSQSYAANDPNVQIFNDDKVAALHKDHPPRGHDGKEVSLREELRHLVMGQSLYCDEILSNKELMEEIRHADLVVGELLYLCSSLVADKLSLPHVIISAATLSTPTAFAFGFPTPPYYVQTVFPPAHELTFVDRVKNVLQWMGMYLFYVYDLCPIFNEIKTKHNITPNKNIQETLGRVDLIIGQMPFPLEHPRPFLPNTRVVGPFLSSPAKPLPNELDDFMKKAGDEGVILISFGTVLRGIEEATLKMMAEAFSKLPQKIIWKLKLEGGTSKISLSDNVKILSWLPQNDILGHPKTRLFIGHAGLNGMLESTYHGVPMICSPFFGDQFLNALIAKQVGFAEKVDLKTTSAEEFAGLIRKVLTQPGYRESAERISKSIKQLPRLPVKEAADWVEYTQAQGGLQYLRPRGLDLPFYQLYLLDILFLAFLVLVVVLFFIRFLLKSVISCLTRSSRKEKAN